MININNSIKELGLARGLLPVETLGLFRAVQDECYMDTRARILTEENFGSTFDGLDFDPERIRTQAFAIVNEMPIGVITLATIPEKVIRTQKYFKLFLNEGFIEVTDFKGITNEEEYPQFFIVPAWTFIKPELRNTQALAGYHFMLEMISIAKEFAPSRTWIEAVAQGYGNKYKFDSNRFDINKRYKQDDLPFPLEIIGENTEGSTSSVKFAQHLGLTKIEGIGSGKSLGPVFVSRVK